MAPTNASAKERAELIIETSDLEHPNPSLLQSFVDGAADRELAASYFLERCNTSSDGIQQFLGEWKSLLRAFTRPGGTIGQDLEREIRIRDGNRCFISRTRSNARDRLTVCPIISLSVLRIQKEDPRYELLGAFLAPSGRDRLLSMAEPEKLKEVQNHWLLSRAASEAFKKGEINVYTYFPSGGPNKFELHDRSIDPESSFLNGLRNKGVRLVTLNGTSESGIDLPNAYLFTIHFRFAHALRWLEIAQILTVTTYYASGILPRRPHRKYQFVKNLLHATWLKTPQLLRLQVHKALAFWGARISEPIVDVFSNAIVQKLPLNMYMKRCPAEIGRRYRSEFCALQIVREQTSIPVPRPIDLIETSTETFIITSRIPGHTVGKSIDLCSDAETDQMVDDLQHYIKELRTIPNPFAEKYAICNSYGEACAVRSGGPFATEAEFNESLRVGHLVQKSDHKIVYTHADLNMRNTLMNNGRISGIIDWEGAAWFPEYYEQVMVHRTVRRHRRYLKLIGRVFEVFGDFRAELEMEKEYQNLVPVDY